MEGNTVYFLVLGNTVYFLVLILLNAQLAGSGGEYNDSQATFRNHKKVNLTLNMTPVIPGSRYSFSENRGYRL